MNNSLGDRMKKYENVWRFYLPIRTPLIIRIDGKAFHTFTKNMERPFDHTFMNVMHETTKILCEKIDGCKLAYTQSDEISLLLTDYENFETQAWFDKNLQKIVSVSASIASAVFNKIFEPYVFFDSRTFVLPKEEVCNYFIWRQKDATRNSILSIGQSKFSHKELQNKSCNQIQDMLLTQKNINFNDFETMEKRGVCCYKENILINGLNRTTWKIDKGIPIFTENREYVEKHL